MTTVTHVDAGSDRPAVLAVLPHFRNEAETASALRSLLAAGYPRLSVLVLDNGDTLERTPVWADDERVTLERPGHNLGWCAAMNHGIAFARARAMPYLLQLNADCEIEPEAIARLVDALEADPHVAAAMPLLHDGARIWSAGSELRFGPNQVRHRLHGRPLAEAPERPREVDFVPGACALLRCAVLEKIGGLDERYFMYLEDAELGLRLRRGGFRLVFVPWARARHSGSSASGGGASPLRKFMMGVNTPRFLRAARSPRLWASFLLFDVLLLPFVCLASLVRGRWPHGPLAKGRGILLGALGHAPGPRDVDTYLRRRQ